MCLCALDFGSLTKFSPACPNVRSVQDLTEKVASFDANISASKIITVGDDSEYCSCFMLPLLLQADHCRTSDLLNIWRWLCSWLRQFA